MKIEIEYMNGKIETYRVDKYLELQDGVELTARGKTNYFNYKTISGWSVIDASLDDTEFKKCREISRLIQSDIMENAKGAPREAPVGMKECTLRHCGTCPHAEKSDKRIAELEAERDNWKKEAMKLDDERDALQNKCSKISLKLLHEENEHARFEKECYTAIEEANKYKAERDKSVEQVENERNKKEDAIYKNSELKTMLDSAEKGKYANFIALNKMRDALDGLKGELETIKGNYDEYCRVCEERDALQERINKALNIFNTQDGKRYFNFCGINDILTGKDTA